MEAQLNLNLFRIFQLINDLIYLTQTDTTVGFLSSDDKKLANIKNRNIIQKTIRVVDSFKTLKLHTRIPKNYRKLVRNSTNTTFIYPNQKSFRVVDNFSNHHKFIKKFGTLYSTSANKTNKNFDKDFAILYCDIEVLNKYEYSENLSSDIIKIYNNRLVKIR